MKTNLLERPDLEAARKCFEHACFYSRQHQDDAIAAIKRHGDGDGVAISGCAREHFPEDVKDHLRLLAFLVTEKSNAGYEARPCGVRVETMRKLARAVATRDGSGFYGPQPNRRG